MKTVQIARELTFALCPKCFWLATWFRKNEDICPICNSKLTMQSVKVHAVESFL